MTDCQKGFCEGYDKGIEHGKETLSSHAVLYDSLPGYDEIDQVANDEANGIDWDSLRYAGIYTDGFIAGALWMKNKIKK